ncbi:hypothetical protein [Halorientalis pallida]|uniref:DUF7995 domain-containing protein n=1 Tax=Halorientalis pallida TaxID=2479928 RepID=A0A498KZN5_9EURY|nr:hypothetical protein [Halorientalis pallida]RXK48020.1 hypothetical protein EAF64_15440 [Halorientalis pallida]
MSDKNPLYDEDDPRGTVYSDPTGDPHTEPDEHDPASGYYPDQKPQREQYDRHTCQDCDREIPESYDRCGLCARKAGETTDRPWPQDDNTKTESDQETPDWTFGRVVFAVVQASTRYEALALGTSAFTLADGDALLGDTNAGYADVKPVADFESSPARHLTAGWGDVVEVAPLDTDDGERLFEAAIERTVQDSGANTHLYLTEGDPLVTQDDVDTLEGQITDGDEQYWLVPGIIRRYKSDPDRAIPESNPEILHCQQCEEDTDHRYTGKSTLEGERGRPVWVCAECDTPRFGHEPGDCKPGEVIEYFIDDWQNDRTSIRDD